MRRIVLQYKALGATLVTLALIVHYLSVRFLLPPPGVKSGDSLFEGFLIFVGSGTGIYAALVFVPLWIFEKYLWRLVNARFDFSGRWSYTSEYEPQETPRKLEKAVEALHRSLPTHGIVTVIQTPFGIRMVEGIGNARRRRPRINEDWHTTSAAIDENTGNVITSYKVYRQPPRDSDVPSFVRGIKEITVEERTWMGRPLILRSRFYNCIGDYPIEFRGRSRFTRVSNRKSLARMSSEG